MSVGRILVESLEMLYEEPSLFVPKLVSTFLSSGFLASLGFKSAGVKSFLSSDPLFFLSVFSFAILMIGVVGVFASLMVAYMVKKRGEKKVLKNSFFEVLEKWREIFVTSLVFLLLGFVVAVPITIGIALFSLNPLLTVYGAAVSLLIIVFVSFYSYFLPIALVENSFFEAFKDSARSSQNNSLEVLMLTFFSLGLFLFAFFIASRPELEALGYFGFVLGRTVSAVVNTYLFVVSPNYYIEN